MSLGNKSLISFLILLVVAVSFIAWLGYTNNQRYHDALVSVNHSNEVLYSVEQLISTAKDIQLFSNNYVFTKNPDYITQFDSAVLRADRQLGALRYLLRDKSAPSSYLVDSLSFYIERRVGFSRQIIQNGLNGNITGAFEIISSGQGIRLMREILTAARRIRQAEQELLQQRQASTDRQLYRFNLLFNLTLGLIFAMTMMTVMITVYNSRLEKKIKNQVEEVSKLNADLERRERRFKGLIENGFEVISLLDKDIKPIYRSPAAERITGWSNDDRTQIVGVEKTHPDDRRHFEATIVRLLNNPGKLFEITIRTLHRNGHYIWLEGFMKNMLHDDSLKGIVSNFRDVTERKKIENQRALYESIIQYSEDAIISKSINGFVITWNKGAELLFGYKAEEIIGKSFEKFTPDDLVDEERSIIDKVQAGIPVENFETERLTKTGKRISISLTASPFFDPHGKMVGTSQIARDITERKNAEEKIHQLNIQLEHKVILRTKELAQVNRELEAVSLYISKGVYKPLQEIRNATEVLRRQLVNESTETRTLIRSIDTNVAAALTLITELIHFSEISQQEIRKTYIDMNELLLEVEQDMPIELRKQNTIICGKLHPVIGDFDLLKKLFINLIRIRHTGEPGYEKSAIEITSEVNLEHVCFSVCDRHTTVYNSILSTGLPGIGIEGDHTLDEKFVSFLTIRHIILKHNGDLRTDIINSTGSGVTIFIPINKSDKL